MSLRFSPSRGAAALVLNSMVRGPAGPGGIAGGTANDFLIKNSNANYDASWVGSLAAKSALGLATVTTDNAIPRFNGTGGETQNSGVTIDDDDNISSAGIGIRNASSPQLVVVNTTNPGQHGYGGFIRFECYNDAGVLKDAAQLNGGFVSVTAGNEQGDIDFAIYRNGVIEVVALTGPQGHTGSYGCFGPEVGAQWIFGSDNQGWMGAYLSGSASGTNLLNTDSVANYLQWGGAGLSAYTNSKLIDRSSSGTSGFIYNRLYSADGNPAIYLGGYSDVTNVYQGNAHTFKNRNGGTTFGFWDSTGLNIYGSSSGSTILTAAASASGTLTLPSATDTLVGRATTDTLTNKTLTSPTINGGSASALTTLGVRSTGSGAFDLRFQNTENLTANRALTVTLNDAGRTLSLAGNVTFGGSFTTSNNLTFSTVGATNVTLPTSGTLSALGGMNTWTAAQTITVSGAVQALTINGDWQNSNGILKINANSGQQFSGLTVQNNGTVKGYFFHDNTASAVYVSSAASDPIVFAMSATSEVARIGATGAPIFASASAIPAGGTAGLGVRVSSTSNFGVFFGSGVPTLSAAKGSLYLRSDGSTTNDRAYINTNGSTTWTALTTAA